MAVLGSSIVNRFTRKGCLIGSDLIMATGTFILATYCYLNQDEALSQAFPYSRWLPIVAILIMYVGMVSGIGSVPYALQAELLPVHARAIGSSLLGVLDNLR